MEYKKDNGGGFFSDPWRVILSLVVILLLAYIAMQPKPSQPQSGGNESVSLTPKAKATVELFVMSQCPYGVQAEMLVKKVIEKFGGEANLSLHFIANEGADGSFSSLHGQAEVEEDMRQVCIMKYYNESTLLSYLSCVYGNYTRVGEVWEKCANESGVDAGRVRSCSTSEEGRELLRSNIKRTNELGVTASPTIYLNGQVYRGNRDESSLTRAICGLIPESKTCESLPPEVAVELIVINDEGCLLCNPSGIEASLKNMITNITIRELDYSRGEGKKLVEELGVEALPVYLFNSSIAQSAAYETLARYLIKVGDYYILNVQPVKLLGRVESNNTVQLFVMSQCPYGTMAETAMKELLDAIPELKFAGLHFIANEVGNGTFQSLHGQAEVEEDMRQVCIMKYYNDKLFDYVTCIAKDYRNAGTVWERCANESGVDAGRVRSCSTSEEGRELLRQNIALSNSLGIGSSPTIMLNNNTLFSTVYANQMKQVVCAYNPYLEGCNKTLSGAGATTTGGGCG